MAVPWIRLLTLTRLLRGTNMVEPPDEASPLRQAFSETVNSSSRVSLPALSCSNTTARVHELGQACRWRELIGILLQQHCPGLGLDEECSGGRGLHAGQRREGAPLCSGLEPL